VAKSTARFFEEICLKKVSAHLSSLLTCTSLLGKPEINTYTSLLGKPEINTYTSLLGKPEIKSADGKDWTQVFLSACMCVFLTIPLFSPSVSFWSFLSHTFLCHLIFRSEYLSFIQFRLFPTRIINITRASDVCFIDTISTCISIAGDIQTGFRQVWHGWF
jgi:hypothetical protein